MTTRKDIFWGLYAAGLPIVLLNLLSYWNHMMRIYVARTFNSSMAFITSAGLYLLMGIFMVVLAYRFLSKPRETSRVPLIGFCIGLGYCALAQLWWILVFLGFSHEETAWILKLVPFANGGYAMFTFLGFYAGLLILYCKTHTFVSKEDLKKEIAE